MDLYGLYWIINHGSQVGPDRSVEVPFLFEPSHTDTDNRRSVGSFRRPAVDSSGSWDCSHPSEVCSLADYFMVITPIWVALYVLKYLCIG